MPVSLSRHGGEGIDDDVEASEIIANQVERVFDEHGNVRPEERSGRIRLAYYRSDLVPSVHRLGAKRPAGAAGPPDDPILMCPPLSARPEFRNRVVS